MAVAGVKTRNVALDALRSFVTLLVVAHHAALAYVAVSSPPRPTAFATADASWMAFPVTDGETWIGFDLFVGWNHVFFMSLMFFVSGIFVWPSLERKGGVTYLKDRALRLGLPFLFASILLSPLAYYPTYLLTGAPPGLETYAKAWMGLGEWPGGPAWFVGTLLAFDCIVTLFHTTAGSTMKLIGRWWAELGRWPVLFFLSLVALSMTAYGIMLSFFGPLLWFGLGPFHVQACRVLLYGLYFLVGLWVGMAGNRSGLLDPEGKLARRWWIWAIIALLAFGLKLDFRAVDLRLAEVALFAISCAASSFFLLAVFLRYNHGGPVWESLGRCAYGIYLVHYVFVTWLQYALVGVTAPALFKFGVVLIGAIGLSWAVAAGLRRIPGVRAIL